MSTYIGDGRGRREEREVDLGAGVADVRGEDWGIGGVPDGISGKCLDPGIQGTGPGGSVCVRSEQPKPSPICLESLKKLQ